MKKDQALDRLKAIEKETKELRKIIEKCDEPKNIIDRIKTISDAVNILGESDCEVIELQKFGNAGISKHIYSYQQLVIICKALNEGWNPNWNDSNEYKYYPYFDMRSTSGFGFSGSLCGGWVGYGYEFRLSPLFQKFKIG